MNNNATICRVCEHQCRVRPRRAKRWDHICKRCERRREKAANGVSLRIIKTKERNK